MDHNEGIRLQADGCLTEPGGYIQWGEWDVNTWEISRIPSAPSQSNDELETLRQWTSTLGNSKPGPSFISSGLVTFPFSPFPFPLLPFSPSTSTESPMTMLTIHHQKVDYPPARHLCRKRPHLGCRGAPQIRPRDRNPPARYLDDGESGDQHKRA